MIVLMVIIAVSLPGNIWHHLTKQPILIVGEIYKIVVLNNFSRKYVFSSALALMALSSIDDGSLPKLCLK